MRGKDGGAALEVNLCGFAALRENNERGSDDASV
jgi:hypothetical protein